jgi:transposase InsO family protein
VYFDGRPNGDTPSSGLKIQYQGVHSSGGTSQPKIVQKLRDIVDTEIAERKSALLAEKPLVDTIAKQRIDRDTLTIRADNGSSMASKPVAFLLADLGVTKTHARPHTSNDNPYVRHDVT